MKNIAVFASGTGSNAINIKQYFDDRTVADVVLLVSDRSTAPVLKANEMQDVSRFIWNYKDPNSLTQLLEVLNTHAIDLLVLAGFLRLIPKELIAAYPAQILNIHPSLLPKYGGKGMYGSKVHQAVWEQGEANSGMSIHLVNEAYDEGQLLFQAICDVRNCTDPSAIAKVVLQLEHHYYPQIIHQYLST